MTYDELLEHINKDIDQGGFVSACGEWFPARSLQALRAVVELHKPVYWQGIEMVCDGCGMDIEQNYNSAYPCSTIEAIEKELL